MAVNEDSVIGMLNLIVHDMSNAIEDVVNGEEIICDLPYASMYALIREWRNNLRAEVERMEHARITHQEIRIVYNPISPVKEDND